MSPLLVQQSLGPEILKLSLQDSKTANAFSIEVARELDKIIQQISSSRSKIRVLIFTGHLRFFCSGGNLKFYKTLKTRAQGLKVNNEITRVLEKLEGLGVYKIALVNGDCLGGGLELMSCFDHVIAVPHSLFGFWQSRQGLSFGWGGGARLANRCSMSIVQKALLSAQVFSAFEAQKFGLVDEVISRHAVDSYVLKHAQRILKISVETYQAIMSLDMKNEKKVFTKLWWTREHRTKLASKPS
jgi:enoyl-CoA hydratase